ncbi:MAG: NAD(P)/FAD-dependent oxidoreductase [Lachnospiraceae bacterium]|nr:NAD(P)/FAD-dependent oxidoreductase [Lachnospiraceae bacterium]
MKRVVVIGGGAAGMMAAIWCARNGSQVTLLEQNEKLGKKLFLTGKGRCNITNACDVSDLFSHVISNPKFLYSAFYGFSNEDTAAFFNALGLKTRVERGNRVFPCSDKSSDVIRVLQQECERQGVAVRLFTKAADVLASEGKVTGVKLCSGETLPAEAVIVATGGLSYSSTGSTGDGYRMAEKLGHTVTALRPGLTGLLVREKTPSILQGLTLKNTAVEITAPSGGKKKLYQGFGELLFTHYGVSGPLMLTASSLLGDRLAEGALVLHIDLKPALSAEQLDARLLRDFEEAGNANVKNAMAHLLPKSMIPVLLTACGIPQEEKINQLTKRERRCIADGMKDFCLTLTGTRDMEEAIITRGGICVDEVDPSTMESRLVKGLYFAGEILDLDALTGGFNLQIAWSTGCMAGNQIDSMD